MSKSIIKEDTSRDISGFYYDIQKSNPMLRVTLHANTKPPVNPYEEWPSWSNEGTDKNFPYYDSKDLDIDEGERPSTPKDTRYGAMPLCSSIVSEDFNIAIANNWGEFTGSQALQDSFNGIFKQLEPYSTFASEQFNKISQATKNYKEGKNKYINEFAKTFSKWSSTASNITGEAGNIFGRTLVVQGTRFKYYGGTGISFSNLGMKFTVFADHVEDFKIEDHQIKKSGSFKWMTPDDQLKPIMPYAIGSYIPFADSNDKMASKLLNELQKVGVDVTSLSDAANKFLGWQVPPGGFKADVQYIDTKQVGTLMLKIGPYYKLMNLVIQDIQLNYSKSIAKYYDTNSNTVKTCPLYCEVFITLSPVSKYSDRVLKEFVMSRTTESSATKSIQSLEKSINSSISMQGTSNTGPS